MDVVEVVVTDEFKEWWEALDNDDAVDVARVVDLLEAEGTALGFPYSSGIKESRFPLRELRVQSRGRPIRVFYAFDPWRQAVLLIAGDKTGDDRFYETFVPKAEAIWEQYLAEEEERRK
ncbi:MAG: type II toxin-antitoxin system RelE/ParE family toxin [Vicinamibacteria bacterium]